MKQKQGEGPRMADDCSSPPFTDCHLSKDKRRVLVLSTEFSVLKQCLQSYHLSVYILCNVFFGCIYMYMVDRVMVVQSESIHYSGRLPNLLWTQYIKLSKKYCSTGRYIISLPYMDTIYQTVKNVLQSWSIY